MSGDQDRKSCLRLHPSVAPTVVHHSSYPCIHTHTQTRFLCTPTPPRSRSLELYIGNLFAILLLKEAIGFALMSTALPEWMLSQHRPRTHGSRLSGHRCGLSTSLRQHRPQLTSSTSHVAPWRGVGCQPEVSSVRSCSAAHDVPAQTYSFRSSSRFTCGAISLNSYPVFSWHISPRARVTMERWGHGKEKSPSPLTPDSS